MKTPSPLRLGLDAPRIRKLLHSGQSEDLAAAVELALRQVLGVLHAEAHYEELSSKARQANWYARLQDTWPRLKPNLRGPQWQEAMAHLVELAYASRPYCVRCGECCRRGSPSLHLEDVRLLTEEILSPGELFTLRRGEPANLNVEGGLGILSEELIKIRQKPGSSECLFYREREHRCAIYEHRPLQCRAQACWDPEALKKLWQREKLTRLHLFEDEPDLQDLIATHDERCPPGEVGTALSRFLDSGDEAALNRVLDIVRYDTALRSFFMQNLERKGEELDLLFGRPLAYLLGAYGVRLEKTAAGSSRLVPEP